MSIAGPEAEHETASFLTADAPQLSLEFEQGVASVYLARAKLRVSAADVYSDSYTDHEVGFWHDEAIVPGRTTMPFPDWLVRRWQQYGRFHGQVQDFYSDSHRQLVWLSADLRTDGDVGVCTFLLSPSTIAASMRLLEDLASKARVPVQDLLWSGILAVSRLEHWDEMLKREIPRPTLVRFQVASTSASRTDARAILKRKLRH